MAINSQFEEETKNIFWELGAYKSNNPRFLFAGVVLASAVLGFCISFFILGEQEFSRTGYVVTMASILGGYGLGKKLVYKYFGKPDGYKDN